MSHFHANSPEQLSSRRSPPSGFPIFENLLNSQHNLSQKQSKNYLKSLNIAYTLKNSLGALETSLEALKSRFGVTEETSHKHKSSDLSEATSCTSDLCVSSVSPSRVLDPLDSSLICKSCLMVVSHPKECKECQTLLCFTCVLSLASCPSGCPIQGFREPVHIVKDVLDKLNVKCTFEKEGCNALLKIPQVKSHEDECAFRTQKCNSPICETQINVWEEEEFCSDLCRIVSAFHDDIKTGTKELKLYKFKKKLAGARNELYNQARRELKDKYDSLEAFKCK